MNRFALGALGAATTVLFVEWLHWSASRRHLGSAPRSGIGACEAIIVLGYPTRKNGRLHPLQRWRTEIAVRSMDPQANSRVVFTGGAQAGRPSEAEAMAGYAERVLNVAADRIVLEPKARNTWQNIELTLPIMERADVIKIASDPMHAARARRHLRDLRPDLADRVAHSADYRFLERPWCKFPTAVYELFALARSKAWALARAGHVGTSFASDPLSHDDVELRRPAQAGMPST